MTGDLPTSPVVAAMIACIVFIRSVMSRHGEFITTSHEQ